VGQGQIVSIFCAVGVHAREKDFAGPRFSHMLCPFDGIQICSRPPAVCVHVRGPSLSFLESMATTMHWLPNRSEM